MRKKDDQSTTHRYRPIEKERCKTHTTATDVLVSCSKLRSGAELASSTSASCVPLAIEASAANLWPSRKSEWGSAIELLPHSRWTNVICLHLHLPPTRLPSGMRRRHDRLTTEPSSFNVRCHSINHTLTSSTQCRGSVPVPKRARRRQSRRSGSLPSMRTCPARTLPTWPRDRLTVSQQ